jgi:hypothetical protein
VITSLTGNPLVRNYVGTAINCGLKRRAQMGKKLLSAIALGSPGWAAVSTNELPGCVCNVTASPPCTIHAIPTVQTWTFNHRLITEFVVISLALTLNVERIPLNYSVEEVANRDIRIWHFVIKNDS